MTSNRRDWLRAATFGLAAPTLARGSLAPDRKPTRFQVACMTLPYSRFPLARALSGIKGAGFEFVAWGTTHREASGPEPVLGPEAPLDRARELGKKSRELGLEPLLMFSGIYPEAPEAPKILLSRIRQASAAGVKQVLTFGHTRGGSHASSGSSGFKAAGPGRPRKTA